MAASKAKITQLKITLFCNSQQDICNKELLENDEVWHT